MSLPSLYSKPNPSLKAIFFILIAVTLYTIANAGTKLALDFISIPYLILIRTFFCTLFFGIIILLRFPHSPWIHFKTTQPKGHLIRGLLTDTALIFIYLGFSTLTFANATILLFSNAIFAALLGHFLFKDRLTQIQVLGLVLGFLGVFLTYGQSLVGSQILSIGALAMLLGACLDGVQTALPRHLGKTEDVWTLCVWYSFTTLLFSPISLLMGSWFWGWQAFPTLSFSQWGILIFINLTGSIGQIFGTQAFIIASPGVVSPFLYFALLPSVFLGFLLWDTLPTFLTWGGCTCIALGGILIAHRERK